MVREGEVQVPRVTGVGKGREEMGRRETRNKVKERRWKLKLMKNLIQSYRQLKRGRKGPRAGKRCQDEVGWRMAGR